MAVVAIIQARLGSKRFPGKILERVRDKPILWFVYDRTRRCRAVDQTVIATSALSQDDPVQAFCDKNNIACFRGSETDVLGRYYETARKCNADDVFRITADCPLVDPNWLGVLQEFFKREDLDYSGLGETFPDGFNAELFGFGSLERAYHEARLGSEREHVTPYLKAHPELFRMLPYEIPQTAAELGFPQLRKLNHLLLSLDEPHDFKVLSSVLEQLYFDNPEFSMEDTLKLIVAEKCPKPRTDPRGSAVGYLQGLKK